MWIFQQNEPSIITAKTYTDIEWYIYSGFDKFIMFIMFPAAAGAALWGDGN